jgi:hypothetical protein
MAWCLVKYRDKFTFFILKKFLLLWSPKFVTVTTKVRLVLDQILLNDFFFKETRVSWLGLLTFVSVLF